jgi:hypothetical protein
MIGRGCVWVYPRCRSTNPSLPQLLLVQVEEQNRRSGRNPKSQNHTLGRAVTLGLFGAIAALASSCPSAFSLLSFPLCGTAPRSRWRSCLSSTTWYRRHKAPRHSFFSEPDSCSHGSHDDGLSPAGGGSGAERMEDEELADGR